MRPWRIDWNLRKKKPVKSNPIDLKKSDIKTILLKNPAHFFVLGLFFWISSFCLQNPPDPSKTPLLRAKEGQ